MHNERTNRQETVFEKCLWQLCNLQGLIWGHLKQPAGEFPPSEEPRLELALPLAVPPSCVKGVVGGGGDGWQFSSE